jgi:hypothetical protein
MTSPSLAGQRSRGIDAFLRDVLNQRAGGDSAWVYDTSSRTYRDTRTGRYVSATEQIALRDEVVARYRDRAQATTGDLLDGKLTAAQYQARMQAHLQSAHTAQYAFGRGGISQVSEADRARIAATLDSQFEYLHGFASAIHAGELSEAQISSRADLYLNATTMSYERGRMAAHGDLELDQVPGDGSTECGSNCLCSLDIQETDTGWEVTWQLDDPASGSCDDCLALAAEWNPLVVDAPAD